MHCTILFYNDGTRECCSLLHLIKLPCGIFSGMLAQIEATGWGTWMLLCMQELHRFMKEKAEEPFPLQRAWYWKTFSSPPIDAASSAAERASCNLYILRNI